MKSKKSDMVRTRKYGQVRGQINMTETVAVLFVFFVLLFFGIIFYYQYQKVAIKEKQQELLAGRAMETTLKVLYLPELGCTRGAAEPEDNCVDVAKLSHAAALFQDRAGEYYFELFSYANISVTQFYPEPRTYVLYDRPKPGYTQKEPTYFVLVLKNDTSGRVDPTYSIGYLTVEVYS